MTSSQGFLVAALLGEVTVGILALQVWQQLQTRQVRGAARWLPLAVAVEAVGRGWWLTRQEFGPAGLGWLVSVMGASAVVYVAWRLGQQTAETCGQKGTLRRVAIVLEKTQEDEEDE